MPKYHITKYGEARPCTATERPCPLGGEHFGSMREAAIAAAASHRQSRAEAVSRWAFEAQDDFGLSDDERLHLESLLEDADEDYWEAVVEDFGRNRDIASYLPMPTGIQDEDEEATPMSELLGQPFEGTYDADWLDREDPAEWEAQFDWLSPESLRSYATTDADPIQIEEEIEQAREYLRLVVREARKRGIDYLVPDPYRS